MLKGEWRDAVRHSSNGDAIRSGTVCRQRRGRSGSWFAGHGEIFPKEFK